MSEFTQRKGARRISEIPPDILDALNAGEIESVNLVELHGDPSRYVQNSVANWLNDASKSRPDWVKEICAQWSKKSQSKETAYIINRALRTLKNKGARPFV